MSRKRPAASKKPAGSDDEEGLRRRAEVRLRGRRKDRTPVADVPRTLHELEVHQVELELQNAELRRVRNELEVTVEKYRDLYDFAPVGYLSVDDAGVILEANLTSAALLGIVRSRLIKRRLSSFVSASSRPDVLAFLEKACIGSGDEACEALLVKEGGGTLWASLRARPATALEGARPWCRIAVGDISARKQAEAAQRRAEALSDANRTLKLEIARRRDVEDKLRKNERELSKMLAQSRHMHAKLRTMTHRVLRAQEEERKRVSRDLHDEIAQMLVGVNLRLTALTRDTADQPRSFRNALARALQLVEHSVEVVQRFARDLRPKMLDDLGLVPALRAFMAQFAKQTGVRSHLTVHGGAEQLSAVQRTVLFRVAQEALANVARHARASEVEVKLENRPDRMCITITDDGRSFRPQRVMSSASTNRLGLVGMTERLHMVGGELRVVAAAGKGTTIAAEIPLGKAARSSGPG